MLKERVEMKLKAVSGIVLILLSVGMLTFVINIQPVKSDPFTWIVDDNGPANFHTIQEAIDSNMVAEGDTIYVRAGTYYEHIIINKTVSLIGENKENTIIEGYGEVPYAGYAAVFVTADDVHISGFTIRIMNVSWYGWAMNGIFIYQCTNTTVQNSILMDNGHGIQVRWSSNNVFLGNDFRANQETGISFVESSNNVILRNKIEYSGWVGVYLVGSANNVVSYNEMQNNSVLGIYLFESQNNIISQNNITNNNEYGIMLSHSFNNRLYDNNIIDNEEQGMRLLDSSNNIIYHNNFINNKQQVYDWSKDQPSYPQSTNIWNDSYPSGGNYWSDYNGTDFYGGPYQNETGSDGIGDTPYVIDANNRDNYPLMNPWNPPLSYTLTIHSSPSGVTFTADGVSRTTPWIGIFNEGTSVNLEMPEIHTAGDARYYWDQWSDGNTSRSRTVALTTNVTLTAYYTGPYYELTVTSSPITGIPFTINGTPQTTPQTEWMIEGSYILQMPQTYPGYVWSHWLEDGDTNRIKIVTMDRNISLTGVFTSSDQTRIVGVSEGDWFKYDVSFSWTSNDPDATFSNPELNVTEWMMISIVKVYGTNVTGQITMHFENGTEEILVGSVDIDTGEGRNITMFVISAGLNASDAVYTSFLYSSMKINETILRPYQGSVRETNHLNITVEYEFMGFYQYMSMNYYWDKSTGILVEMSQEQILQTGEYVTNSSIRYRIIESNVWIIPEFPSLLVLPLFMITTLLAVIVYKTKHTM